MFAAKRLYLAGTALLLSASGLTTPAYAHPEVPGPSGRTCALGIFSDESPEADPDAQFGVMWGGPIVSEDNGTLACTLQVNASLHSGPDTVSRSALSDNGVTTLLAADVAALVPPESTLYLCTSWTTASGTIYLSANDPNDPLSNVDTYYWTANPNAACPPMTIQLQPDRGVIANVALEVVNQLLATDPDVERAVCSTGGFGAESDPVYIHSTGDVYLNGQRIWDCAPYGDTNTGPMQQQPSSPSNASGHYG